MKKLIITLMALAVLFSLAVPAMAASPVKDYATAEDGDLLYTVNFNGDEAFTGTVSAGFKYHDITALSSTELEVKGNKWHDPEEGKYAGGEGMNTGNIYAGAIKGLAANATTKYTMTYQVWINETDGGAYTHGGKDCYVGVGGLVEDPAASSQKWINFTSNYFTETAENRSYSLRSRSAKLKDAEGNEAAGVFTDAVTPVKDNGYYTVRLTFDGTTATVTAYILTNGTGAKDSDWTKLTAAGYNVSDTNNMAFAIYCQSSALHCKIKNVNIYKGLVTGVKETVQDEPSTSTTDATTGTEATTGGSSTDDENAKTADNFAGIVIAMALLSAGAVVALSANRKKF